MINVALALIWKIDSATKVQNLSTIIVNSEQGTNLVCSLKYIDYVEFLYSDCHIIQLFTFQVSQLFYS